MILNKIKCIIGRQNLKYGFLDFINTSNNGSPGFGYAINGGGYIILIREGDNISRIVIENLRLAPNQNQHNKNGIQKKLVLALLYAFYLN